MGKASKNKALHVRAAKLATEMHVAGAAQTAAELEQHGQKSVAETAAEHAQQKDAMACQECSEPWLCAGCGERMCTGQWVVHFLNRSEGCHLSCWEDPANPRVAAKLAVLKTGEDSMVHVMLKVPVHELEEIDSQMPIIAVVEMSKNLKQARRVLRAACDDREKLRDDVLHLRQEVSSAKEQMARERLLAHGAKAELTACTAERDIARSERDAARELLQNLQKQLREEKEHVRALNGQTVDTLHKDKLVDLRAQLQKALQRVDDWQAAQEIVEREFPDLCCSISTHLMIDPVFTLDGRTYERQQIEKHFEFLKKHDQPIMTPQRQPLESTKLVPNYALKTHIAAMVQKKAEELAAAGGSKRRRDN
jgi:hypothetical protein